MHSRLAPLSLLVLALASACGNPRSNDVKAKPAAAADPADQAPPARPSWQREAIPMPATFSGFPRPDLATLDGVWIVDAGRARGRMVWVFEDQGSKLTTLSSVGTEEIFGVTLSSPCALRLTDSEGDAQSRTLARLDDGLILTQKGAVALEASDGGLLACLGHRTYQITADGQCRFTTELLGVWGDPTEAAASCSLETKDGAKQLTIAGQVLREAQPGVWLDEVAAAARATPAESREAALATIQAPAAAAAAGDEAATGTGETGGETEPETEPAAAPAAP